MSNIEKATEHHGADAFEMIKLILQKHDAEVIEASIEAIKQARTEEKEKLSQWMMERSYSTGHGETIEDLLKELQWQLHERWQGAIAYTMREEREACARVCESAGPDAGPIYCASAIRARGRA